VELYVRPFYEQYIFPKLTANQSAVLVPGGFALKVLRQYMHACMHACMRE